MRADLRQAILSLIRSRSFALIAILTLALGIGSATAIFTVVDAVLLQPLGYKDPERIVSIGTKSSDTGRATTRITGGDLVDLRNENALFEAFSSYQGGEVGVQLAGRAEFAGTYFVNGAFFPVFGVKPVAGRLFDDSEAGRTAIISEA
ncbi:MAG: ABC transporter permease, partial [Nitrospiraceae bacterium]|nr:ABC transporter permease [Nitrospiraceae bacterium]